MAAQMIARAIAKADGDDVTKMIGALEGWTFEAPKGQETVRAADHAMVQPMFIVKLTGPISSMEPQVLRTLPAGAAAPPVQPFK